MTMYGYVYTHLFTRYFKHMTVDLHCICTYCTYVYKHMCLMCFKPIYLLNTYLYMFTFTSTTVCTK